MAARASDKLYHRVNHLFAESLTGGWDEDRAWKAIRTLHRLENRLIFKRTKAWCSSPVSLKRARAADIMAQLGCRTKRRFKQRLGQEPAFRQESFQAITEMLTCETDLDALHSQIIALGFLNISDAVPFIVPFAEHPSEDIRYAVTRALNNYADDPASISVLSRLAEDSDKDVRDWAIFALGVIGNADSEELRQLFLAHVEDSFEDARIEAVASLGKRKDVRVVPTLIKMIRNTGPGRVLLEAARELLEMDEDPLSWYAKEYIAALEAKFPEAAVAKD